MTMKVFEPASGPEIVEPQEYHGCNKQNSEIENVQEFSWTIMKGPHWRLAHAASDTTDTSPAGW
ncbi:MAG TPA: hypothetical protein DCM34_04650 [Salmonella bongori]|uniref:Uncharacterized protein n=1 Tax=Salmonella bongori serovar 66:z41:- str. SA19983605 TaxID=1243617 RepID=A0A248KBG8_SALBN|nr:hypothetical protein LFZ56_16170 [Salmonella bongori serovar 66:z41:- str. SA19983605]ECC8731742.1 hypothetical protein [Salmonella bongori]ECC9751342.1 hypothetical protein [Salmonella bongori]ECE6545124.1 hypothetical protein [Salmonella bongori]ECI3516737.1 hypothetical protein [Salmonella bongori]